MPSEENCAAAGSLLPPITVKTSGIVIVIVNLCLLTVEQMGCFPSPMTSSTRMISGDIDLKMVLSLEETVRILARMKCLFILQDAGVRVG